MAYLTMVAVTTDTTELTAADLATTVMPFLQDAATQIFGSINELAQLVIDSRIMCVNCAADRQRAAAAGTPEKELPPVNTVNVIAAGNGLCFAHIQFTDKPILPGQTASGLYVAGAGR